MQFRQSERNSRGSKKSFQDEVDEGYKLNSVISLQDQPSPLPSWKRQADRGVVRWDFERFHREAALKDSPEDAFGHCLKLSLATDSVKSNRMDEEAPWTPARFLGLKATKKKEKRLSDLVQFSNEYAINSESDLSCSQFSWLRGTSMFSLSGLNHVVVFNPGNAKLTYDVIKREQFTNEIGSNAWGSKQALYIAQAFNTIELMDIERKITVRTVETNADYFGQNRIWSIKTMERFGSGNQVFAAINNQIRRFDFNERNANHLNLSFSSGDRYYTQTKQLLVLDQHTVVNLGLDGTPTLWDARRPGQVLHKITQAGTVALMDYNLHCVNQLVLCDDTNRLMTYDIGSGRVLDQKHLTGNWTAGVCWHDNGTIATFQNGRKVGLALWKTSNDGKLRLEEEHIVQNYNPNSFISVVSGHKEGYMSVILGSFKFSQPEDREEDNITIIKYGLEQPAQIAHCESIDELRP